MFCKEFLLSFVGYSISDSLRNVAFSVLIYETIMDTLPFLCYNNMEFVYLQIEKRSLCFIIFYS